jgi:hypothetical protein
MALTSGPNADRILRMAATAGICRKQVDRIRKEAVETMGTTATARNKGIQKMMTVAIEMLEQEAGEQQIMMTMRNRYAW